jgi:hypothetical protein
MDAEWTVICKSTPLNRRACSKTDASGPYEAGLARTDEPGWFSTTILPMWARVATRRRASGASTKGTRAWMMGLTLPSRSSYMHAAAWR